MQQCEDTSQFENQLHAFVKLTLEEEEIVLEYDSRLFGFIKFDASENIPKKHLLIKAIQDYEHRLKIEPNNLVCAKYTLMLGHWFLLLEECSKALLNYQTLYSYNLKDLQDSTFFYGLGLTYFYFGAFRYAIKSFLYALYKDPGFIRTNEIHFRLALIYKELSQFDLSLKHFNLAFTDSNNSSISKQEIKFCIAHLIETKGNHLTACEKYEELLKSDDLTDKLRAKILRQIGWLYFYSEQLNSKGCQNIHLKAPINQLYAKVSNHQSVSINIENLNKSIDFLVKSTELDSSQCLTWYYLGRANTTKGNLRDAFNSYRNSVNSSESNADTWCSIGVLYQQQNQSMDALQAYICAVQLDEKNHAAWLNLGILYETLSQYNDALNCFTKALNCYDSCLHNAELNHKLKERIKILESLIKHSSELTSNNNCEIDNKNKLPALKEAFSLPIPTEVSSRKSNCENNSIEYESMVVNLEYKKTKDLWVFHDNNINLNDNSINISNQSPIKKIKTKKNDFTNLSEQHMSLMHQLDNYRNLNPDQIQMLNHLKNNSNQSQNCKQNVLFSNNNNNGISINQIHAKNNLPINQMNKSNTVSEFLNDGLPKDLENVNPTMNSSHDDLSILLSQHDIAEDIRISNDDKCELDLVLANMGIKSKLKTINSFDSNDYKKNYPIDIIKLDSSLLMQHEAYLNEPHINIDMSSNQLLKACKGFGLNGVQNTNILSKKCKSPSKIDINFRQFSKDQLNPTIPSVILESKKDALAPQLQQYCLSNPITVVRGLAGVLKLDLSLFSTKTLVETDGEQIVEVRTQRQQSSDENYDNQFKNQVWKCESGRSYTSISKYAQYQAYTFQETLKDEAQIKNNCSPNQDSKQNFENLNDISKSKLNIYDSEFIKNSQSNIKNTVSPKRFKMIKFCTNVDLSDDKKWKLQLQELSKLPPFMRIVSASNMLSHVGHKILGMNTLQLYMKVPGSRTPGHQENNNFCAININIGPGDCEWFAVSNCYWNLIEELCEKNSCDYLNGSWWPKLEDLYSNNIPVYRFIQKPGDLVWVNTGCVHWVQAIGWCNNIAWNVGPITYLQYKFSIERYEWNKYKHYKSIVPMLHLTWNIARNIKISDRRLYELVKYVLMQSLKQSQLTINYIENCDLDIKLQKRQLYEPAHYCIDCDSEVFNILFVSEQDKKHVVHCQDCARRRNNLLDNFFILYQYSLDELKLIYDQFVLYTPQLNNI